MAPTYTQVLQQIDKLKARASEMRSGALRDAVKQLKQIMQDHSLSWSEVQSLAGFAPRGAGSRERARGPKGSKRSKGTAKRSKQPKRTRAAKDGRAVVKPKYRHPESGQTWSGRGHTPRWLAAEEKAGKKRESFLIGS